MLQLIGMKSMRKRIWKGFVTVAMLVVVTFGVTANVTYAAIAADVYITEDGASGSTPITSLTVLPGNSYTLKAWAELSDNGGLGMFSYAVQMQVSDTNVTVLPNTTTNISSTWDFGGSAGTPSGSPVNDLDDIGASIFINPPPGSTGSPVGLFTFNLTIPTNAPVSGSSVLTLSDPTGIPEKGIYVDDGLNLVAVPTSYTPVTITVIPEPASLLILGGLASGLLLRRRR